MKSATLLRAARLGTLGLLPVLVACNDNDGDTTPASSLELKAHSVTPALVKVMPGFESLQILPLISSDDVLSESPGFVFGPQPDGAGLLRNPAGEGFVLINNHEISQSVSRVYLDKTFKPVKGEYIVDYNGGTTRLCSATLATPEEHGFPRAMFLTAGESGAESMVHAIDPVGPLDKTNSGRRKPALGKASMENAVPLNKQAYPGKTVIIIGEDNTDGQVLLYVSNTPGDLENGKLYMMKRPNGDPVETSLSTGTAYDVEWVEIPGVSSMTGAQIAAFSVTNSALQLARVEDLDYRKGSAANNREIYFTATGVSQADKVTPVAGKTMWGRVYKLNLNATNAVGPAKLEVVVDGGTEPGRYIVNPDNICVTDNYVYIQEDGDSFYRDTDHDGRIWQWAINAPGQRAKAMLEMDHRRTDATFNAKYNPSNSLSKSSWEYGAMYDISDLVNKPNTFLVNIHPHTWQDPKFRNADGSGAAANTNAEGGQVVILRGVAK
ncbi:alkaline phosphatase PhoX [Hymenobacter sp. IS2118]|uniref:alkaline phosphatase PhoX n=1 Tax=Hymenobacter sp. IS2118 TaxID=1505605 RepID=UPI000550D205|nr:alkaline phosphatase PhoX [Hymenobacter sp. IS2118]